MKLMCGNCGKDDHKYVDCPYTENPITKKEWKAAQKLRELIEKYSKLDAYGAFCEQLLEESKK